jgi:hypothetical protein
MFSLRKPSEQFIGRFLEDQKGDQFSYSEVGFSQVEWERSDDSVYYKIFAFSRPNHWLSRTGYLFSRRIQKSFAAGSMTAMVRAVAQPA